MGTFANFLKDKKLVDAQIIGVSRILERLNPEDRETLRKRHVARKTEKKYDEVGATKKPHSGRGVSAQALDKARADIPLPRKVRSKIAASINIILKRRGGAEVKQKDLFGEILVAKGKAPVKKKKK